MHSPCLAIVSPNRQICFCRVSSLVLWGGGRGFVDVNLFQGGGIGRKLGFSSRVLIGAQDVSQDAGRLFPA